MVLIWESVPWGTTTIPFNTQYLKKICHETIHLIGTILDTRERLVKIMVFKTREF